MGGTTASCDTSQAHVYEHAHITQQDIESQGVPRMSKESHGGLMTSMERSIPCKSGVKSNIAFMHDIIIIFTLQNNFCEITQLLFAL